MTSFTQRVLGIPNLAYDKSKDNSVYHIFDKKLNIDDTTGIKDFVLPNKKPIETINWLANYAIPKKYPNGADILFFENRIGYFFCSLQHLFSTDSALTFYYNPKNVEGDIYSKMTNVLAFELLSQVDTLDATNKGTFANRTISIDATGIGGPNNTLTAGDITIHDNGSIAQAQMTSDYVNVYNSSTNTNSQLASDTLDIIDSTNSISLHISKNTFNMTDTPANMIVNIINDSSTFTEPLIQLQNSTGIITTYAQSGIDADGHNCFILDNKERFMKQRNPFSFQVTELNDGNFIERNYPFVFLNIDSEYEKIPNLNLKLDDVNIEENIILPSKLTTIGDNAFLIGVDT